MGEAMTSNFQKQFSLKKPSRGCHRVRYVWLPMTASIRPGEIAALTVTSDRSEMPGCAGQTAGFMQGHSGLDGYNAKHDLSVIIFYQNQH